MANVTLYLSDQLKKRMDEHPEIRWSSSVRTIIEEKLDALERAERLAKGSRVTQADVDRLTRKVERAAAKHARKLLHEARS